MQEYIFKLDKKDEASLAQVRCYESLQAARDENHIWLRGINTLLYEDVKLKQLPAKNTFIINEHNLLFHTGGLTAVGKLGQLEWQSLSVFIKIESPVSALPGRTNEKFPVRLIPSDRSRKGAALITSLSLWKEYAETASAIRLLATRFAVSEKNKVLITGELLPPLPGIEYWLENNILLPSGYEFEIPMVSRFVEKKLNAYAEALLVFNTDGSWYRVEKSYFVQSKRSAIRLTKESSSDD